MDAVDQEYVARKLLSGFENLLDISVDFVAELGTTNITIQRLLKLQVKAWNFTSTARFLVKAKSWFMKKTLQFVSMKY